MMIGKHVTKGGAELEGIFIGYFMVVRCCGPDEDPNYAVLHTPSNGKITCGLSKEGALAVADTLSVESKDEPTSENIEEAMKQVGMDLTVWARTTNGMPYKEWIALSPEDRPRPSQPSSGMTIMLITPDGITDLLSGRTLSLPSESSKDKQN